MGNLAPIPDARTQTEEWLKWKADRISGHDAATLCGVNKYQSLDQLYDRIVHGIRTQRSIEDEKFLKWRLSLEDNIADRYVADTSRKIRRTGSKYHPTNPRIISSVDREILKDERGVGVLEIKSRDPIIWKQIKLAGAPAEDFAQTQHYMMVGERLWGEICEANVSSGEQITVPTAADLEFEQVLMIRITEFLAACDARERPKIEEFEATRMPAVGGELITVDQMTEDLIAEFSSLSGAITSSRDILAQAKEYHDGVRSAAQKWMLTNSIDVVEGFGIRVYNKEQAGRKTLDKTTFKREHPDVDIDAYYKQGQPFRSFRVYDRQLRIRGE